MTAPPSPASHTSPGAVTAVRSVLSVPASRLADERLHLGAVQRDERWGGEHGTACVTSLVIRGRQ